MLTLSMQSWPLCFAGDFGGAEVNEVELRDALAGAVAGNRDDLARLYDLSARELFGLALWKSGDRGLAEDAVQEVFCRIAAGKARPPVRLRDAKAWLLTCVRNAVVDLLRRPAGSAGAGGPIGVAAGAVASLELFESVGTDPTEALSMSHAVAALPPKLREAVYLHVYLGMSFREAAEVSSVPTFTAASRYRLALKQLQERLGHRR
jgi:RNA polymerase sigma factor (sigma-70 family)